MRKNWIRIFSLCMLTLSISASAVNPILEKIRGNAKADTEARQKFREELKEMDRNQILQALPLGKDTALIRKMQLKQGQILLREYEKLNSERLKIFGKDIKKDAHKSEQVMVEKFRKGEVLVVSIPSKLIFMPNGTEMTQNASEYLRPLLKFLRNPDMYWMILDMHTDNTGSRQYSDSLAVSRVETVYDWISNSGADTDYVFLSATGSSEPLPGTSNISMEERARNRRMEVYLVPGKKMLDEAQKGRISFAK